MRRRLVWGAALAATVVSGIALAQTDVIKMRQHLMESNEQAAKVAFLMIRGTIPYDANMAAATMLAISSSNEIFPTFFPAGSDKAPSKATPAVFTDMAAFKAASAKMAEDAKKAAGEAAKGVDAFKAAFNVVGQNCDDCHGKYRKK